MNRFVRAAWLACAMAVGVWLGFAVDRSLEATRHAEAGPISVCVLSVGTQPAIWVSMDCWLKPFEVLGEVHCVDAGGLSCPSVSLMAEVYQWTGTGWVFRGPEMISGWTLPCGRNASVDRCWQPKRWDEDSAVRAYVAFQAGFNNPNGAILGNVAVATFYP